MGIRLRVCSSFPLYFHCSAVYLCLSRSDPAGEGVEEATDFGNNMKFGTVNLCPRRDGRTMNDMWAFQRAEYASATQTDADEGMSTIHLNTQKQYLYHVTWQFLVGLLIKKFLRHTIAEGICKDFKSKTFWVLSLWAGKIGHNIVRIKLN